MTDGRKPFATVVLPKDTAKMIDQLVSAAATWGARVSDAESESEREAYHMLCYARKWLSEHVEDLCQAAGVEPAEGDQTIRYM